MPKVTSRALVTAYKNYKEGAPNGSPNHFWKAVGVTAKQRAKYKQSQRKVLKVRAVTAAKIAMLAASSSGHHHALMKAIEARYSTEQ